MNSERTMSTLIAFIAEMPGALLDPAERGHDECREREIKPGKERRIQQQQTTAEPEIRSWRIVAPNARFARI